MFKFSNTERIKSVGRLDPSTLVHGDCLEVMEYIADGSVDLVAVDPPYE